MAGIAGRERGLSDLQAGRSIARRYERTAMKSVPQNVSESVRRRNPHLYGKNHNPPQGLPAVESERAQGRPLDGPAPRETSRGSGSAPRFAIRFVVRSRRPMDWDNAGGGSLKRLQDLLVQPLGILPGDGWDVLEGQVVSEKCANAEEEGVTVIIETP